MQKYQSKSINTYFLDLQLTWQIKIQIMIINIGLCSFYKNICKKGVGWSDSKSGLFIEGLRWQDIIYDSTILYKV